MKNFLRTGCRIRRNPKLTSCSIVEVYTIADGTPKDGGIKKSQSITCCQLIKTREYGIMFENGDCHKRETTNNHVLQRVLI